MNMRELLPFVAAFIVTTFASTHCPENSVATDQLSACFPTCSQEQDPKVNCMLPGHLGDGCRCKDVYLWNENRTECIHECDCPFGYPEHWRKFTASAFWTMIEERCPEALHRLDPNVMRSARKDVTVKEWKAKVLKEGNVNATKEKKANAVKERKVNAMKEQNVSSTNESAVDVTTSPK